MQTSSTFLRTSLMALGLLAGAAAHAQQTDPVISSAFLLSLTYTQANDSDQQFKIDGTAGQSSVTSGVTRDTGWTTWGSVNLAGPDSLPVLKGIAQSQPGTVAQIGGVGVQLYTYHGADTIKTLSSSLSSTGGSVFMQVYVYEAQSFLSAVKDGMSLWTVPEDATTKKHVSVLAHTDLGVGSTTGNSGDASFSLVNGQQFVVWSLMSVSAFNGEIADASHTGVMRFADSSGLTAQVSAVPEPTSLLLMGMGIAALGLYRGRRQARAS